MSQDQDDNETRSATVAQAAPDALPAPTAGRLKNGRFEKGHTGNRKGRPRKSERAWSNRQLTNDILLEANAEVPVSRDGKVEFVPMHRLILRRLLNQAAKGDRWAQKMGLDYIRRAQAAHEAKHWEFHRDLERVEATFEEASVRFPGAPISKERDAWRKKSRIV